MIISTWSSKSNVVCCARQDGLAIRGCGLPLLSSRQCYHIDVCLEDNREDY